MGHAADIATARKGAEVAINYFPSEEPDAREVIEVIKPEGRKAIVIPGVLREESFCQSLVVEAARGLGGLDILVNNAARQQTHDSILDISTEQFDWAMKTNIYAQFELLRRPFRICCQGQSKLVQPPSKLMTLHWIFMIMPRPRPPQ